MGPLNTAPANMAPAAVYFVREFDTVTTLDTFFISYSRVIQRTHNRNGNIWGTRWPRLRHGWHDGIVILWYKWSSRWPGIIIWPANTCYATVIFFHIWMQPWWHFCFLLVRGLLTIMLQRRFTLVTSYWANVFWFKPRVGKSGHCGSSQAMIRVTVTQFSFCRYFAHHLTQGTFSNCHVIIPATTLSPAGVATLEKCSTGWV